jgi:hypothetical protein
LPDGLLATFDRNIGDNNSCTFSGKDERSRLPNT